MDSQEKSTVFFLIIAAITLLILCVLFASGICKAGEVTLHWTWPTFNSDSLDCTKIDSTSILYDLKGARVWGVRVPFPDTLDFGEILAPSPGVEDSATFTFADNVHYVEFIFKTLDIDNNFCCLSSHCVKEIPYQESNLGLTGAYYVWDYWSRNDPNHGLVTLLGSRRDSVVAFDWGAGNAWPGGPSDYFGERWTGKIYIPITGNYTFYINHDEGIRYWIDSNLVQDYWVYMNGETSNTIFLAAGEHPIQLEHFESWGNAHCQLYWSGPGITKQIIPKEYLRN